MQEKTKKNSLSLVDNPIPKTLVRITTPMILGMAMLFTFSLVDTLFISFLGTEPLTAISFTFPVTFMIMSLAIGLGIGTSAVIAKYLGKSEFDKAKQASTVTNYLAIFCALIIVLLCWVFNDAIFIGIGASEEMLILIRQYMMIWLPGSIMIVAIMNGNSILRAHGNTKTPSLLMAASGLINAVLDPILIFGLGPVPAMGIAGAALATLISWLIGFGYLTYLLLYRLELISRIIPSRAVFMSSSREMLRIGIPAAGANMMTPIAAGVMTAIASGFGESAVAAFGVGSRIEPLATLLILAMSSTLPPLISQNFGAGRIDRVSEAYRISTRFIVGWQLLVYVVLAICAPLIARIFSDDPEVISVIKLYIWILPLGYGFQGIIILSNSSLNALHRPVEALYLSASRFFVFYVPLAWLGSHYFGLPGFFIGAMIGNGLMAMISLRTFKKAVDLEQRQLAPVEEPS
ncbi:MAG: MATE family efflux transporter [Gammaproteobacteria bacterium]|nr:MATE family efflux transporter [Gammaproteobacteria bacterium]